MRMLTHLPRCYLKELLHKPPIASNTEERESHRHTVAMEPGKEQWDTLSRSDSDDSDVFSIIQPFKRSQLSVLVTLQQHPPRQPPEMKDVLHSTSTTKINISLQTDKKG